FFGALMIGGQHVPTTVIELIDGGAAEAGQMKTGDEITRIDGTRITTFEQMRQIILSSPGQELDVEVMREGKPVVLQVTPEPKGENGGGMIGVAPASTKRVPVELGEAVAIS